MVWNKSEKHIGIDIEQIEEAQQCGVKVQRANTRRENIVILCNKNLILMM